MELIPRGTNLCNPRRVPEFTQKANVNTIEENKMREYQSFEMFKNLEISGDNAPARIKTPTPIKSVRLIKYFHR